MKVSRKVSRGIEGKERERQGKENNNHSEQAENQGNMGYDITNTAT